MSEEEKKPNNPKKKALGRGLGALLTDSQRATGSTETTIRKVAFGNSMDEILLEQIETNPFQPRTHFDQESLEELANSIRLQGIIQPITVRKLNDEKYQLISGERRYQASKMAGLRKIPAYVRTANDQQMLEMALIENIQRENLNAIEIALSYQRLLSECNLKQEELGDRVGKKRTTVNNYLRLLKLPPDIQIALRDNRISMGHARAIINIDDPAKQLYIFNKIMNDGLSVRNVEKLVRDLTTGQNQPKKEPAKHSADHDREYKQLQYKLSSHFGTKVNVKTDEHNRGEIKIPFVSTDDLNRILELLNM